MPYIRKGKCVYRKDTGKKVGCSSSIEKAKDYLKALHVNVTENYTLTQLELIQTCERMLSYYNDRLQD
jgi:hypothetical protein